MDDLLKADAVAKRLGISRPYVYKLVNLGLLPTVSWSVPGKNGERRVIRFHPADVAAFIGKHRRPHDSSSCDTAANPRLTVVDQKIKTSTDRQMRSEVLTVYYSGTAWDEAIEAGLRERGLSRGDCAVLALPESWKAKSDKQRKLFELS